MTFKESTSENTAVLPSEAVLSSADKRSHLVQLVLDSVTSPHSRRAYRTGLDQFFTWWTATAPTEAFGRPLIQRYRASLEEHKRAPATINRSLAPIRKLAEEATFAGLLSAATASAVLAVKEPSASESGQGIGWGVIRPNNSSRCPTGRGWLESAIASCWPCFSAEVCGARSSRL